MKFGEPLNKINSGCLRCTVFLGFKNQVTNHYIVVGTAFFVGLRDHPQDPTRVLDVFLVTAAHTISGLKGKGVENVYVRINLLPGTAWWFETKIEQWQIASDPTVDAAFIKSDVPAATDALAFPPRQQLDEDLQKKFDFNITDDVSIVGLFSNHFGEFRNIPIVRSGHIASVQNDDELVNTVNGKLRCALIEARSIGGLSGSPVLVHVAPHRILKHSIPTDGPHIYLYGLISGHFPVRETELERNDREATGLDRGIVNSGIALVTTFVDVRRAIKSSGWSARPSTTLVPVDDLAHELKFDGLASSGLKIQD